MKFGLFSDVHANADAFDVVLNALDRDGVDQYVFIGDIVGYGAEPGRCVDRLKELIAEKGCLCIAGNHDFAVCGRVSDDRYTRYAREAVEWTKKHINPQQVDFLTGLELTGRADDFVFVHASLDNPAQWSYILDIDDAYPNFKLFDNQICFTGHSHKPIVFKTGDGVDWALEDRILIEKNVKYIINIGSVGQPRDGNPMAAYAVYDTEAALVEIKRVAYDVESAQKKIIDAGLPFWLAERLTLGK